MKLELLCDSGISESHEFAPETDVIMGRGKDCQLRLDDNESSRQHSRIFWKRIDKCANFVGTDARTLDQNHRVSQSQRA